MRHLRLADGQIREALDVTHCGDCGEAFTRGAFTLGWRNCSCTDGNTGHRLVYCRRIGCSGVTPDPPYTGQHGATADYVGITSIGRNDAARDAV